MISTSGRFQSHSRRAGSRSPTSCSSAWSRRSSRARARSSPPGRLIDQYLVINGDLRKRNARKDRVVRRPDRTGDAVARRVLPSLQQHLGRVRLCRSTDLSLSGQGSGPAGAPRLRSRVVCGHADRRRQPRQSAVRRGARHLRAVRHPRPRHGRAVALCAPLGDRASSRATWSRRASASAAAE